MTAHAPFRNPGRLSRNEDFLKFKEFFYRRTGISFEATKRYFVDKRLVERIEATGTGNFRGYFTCCAFRLRAKSCSSSPT
jgi:chemotaxis methyl-accepting protein methylase